MTEEEYDICISCGKITSYKKTDNSRKPRQELSKSALRGLNKIPMKISISFD